MNDNTKKLFQISEAARACGLSRSTLMRMEEKGLLVPAYVAPDSGRRYYDNHNIARILQIEKFRTMGLCAENITAYFTSGGEGGALLAELEAHLREVQRGVEEMRLRVADTPRISVQKMTLPAVTCCMHRCEGHTIAEKYAAMYDFYSQCVRRGYRLSEEPIFTISERHDYLEGYISEEPYPFYVCVPIQGKKIPEEAVTLPECCVLSVLYYGDYDRVDEAWLTLGKEVRSRGLKLTGYPRVLGIVAPYTGREIESRRYCSRLVLPVEE